MGQAVCRNTTTLYQSPSILQTLRDPTPQSGSTSSLTSMLLSLIASDRHKPFKQVGAQVHSHRCNYMLLVHPIF